MKQSESKRSGMSTHDAGSLSLRLSSYDHRALDSFVKQIVDVAYEFGAGIGGPIPIPSTRRLFTVKRSPHIDKKSQDQFEIRTHKRMLRLSNLSAAAVEAISQLRASASVNIKIGGV